MNQGAKRHAFSVRASDLYETPAEAILTLMRVEHLPTGLWEPCAGRGAISRHLKAAGHHVVAQDLHAYEGADEGIETPIDFLLERKAPAGCTCIVTNPPFKLADQFIRHGLRLVPRVIVLLRLMAIEGAGRSDLIDEHLDRIWAGRERLPMMHRDGWSGPKLGVAGVPFAWFVFDAVKRRPHDPVQLRRMSWRGLA
jgi:hypothetical protein